MREKCGQNADTTGKTKIPNSCYTTIWDFLLVPGADFPRCPVVVGVDRHTGTRGAVVLPRREDEPPGILAPRNPDTRTRTESRAVIPLADHRCGDILGSAPRGAVVRRYDPEGAGLRRIGIRLDPAAAEEEDLARLGVGHGGRIHEGIFAAVGRSGQVHRLGPALPVVRTAAYHDVRMALVHPRLMARLTEDQQRTVTGRHDRGNAVGVGSRTRREGGRGFDLREADRPFGPFRTQFGHQRGGHIGPLDLVVRTGRKRTGQHHQQTGHQRRTVHTHVLRFHYSG